MTDDPVSMSPKEEEEFFWNHLPRKERKAIMERRKAREQGQEQSK
jgi:predicted Fe-S protein YdhL (DUF1289 family)